MKKSSRQKIGIAETAIIAALLLLAGWNLLGSIRATAYQAQPQMGAADRSASAFDRAEIDSTIAKIQVARDRNDENRGADFSPAAAAALFGWDPPAPRRVVQEEVPEFSGASQAIQASWLQVVGLISSNGIEKYYIKNTRTGVFFYVQADRSAVGKSGAEASTTGATAHVTGARIEASLVEENEGTLIIRYQGEFYEINR